MSERLAQHAAIKRATKAAHQSMDDLDAAALNELEDIYRQAAADIQAQISRHAGGDGGVALSNLQDLLTQVNGSLKNLSAQRDALFNNAAARAADLGTQPLETALDMSARMRISSEALSFVRTFVAADGLQLSDRVWRLDRHAREVVSNAIEQAVIQGHGAAQAAREFLNRGEAVPSDIQSKLGAANASKIGRDASSALIAGDGSPMDNALRLFRTEINRAHGEAYISSALSHPDAAGLRFLLSPAHPKPDICDLHSTANLYGLGQGVYPSRENCPWPAHPNTLSYVVVVFKDEITEADKAGKETPLQAIDRLTPAQKIGVLGMHKHEAFKAGQLTQGMIKAPWKSVKKRIGNTPTALTPPPAAKVAGNLPLDKMIAAGAEIGDALVVSAKTRNGIHGPTLFAEIHKRLGEARSINTPAAVRNRGKGAELVKAASRMFPDEWTTLADAYGPLYARASTSRGWQRSLAKEDGGRRLRITGFGVLTSEGGEGFISTDSFSTTVHEYVHRLQHVIPKLDDYFQDLHSKRTAGDPLKRLRDLFPGYNYKHDEVTREDKYISAYQGKEYSGYGFPYLGMHGALEVMTIAFEDVLGGDPIRLADIVNHDREMFNLVIGLLFKYVP